MDLKTYLQQTTQTDLAHRLGVTQGLVHQWVTGKTRITAERAVEIEKATGGQVTRQKLRPEIFGTAAA
ncbi:MAG: YdaS family helix-turn-helix protein [Burkholderia sp.]